MNMQALELKLPPPVWALLCCVAAWLFAGRPAGWPPPAPRMLGALALLLGMMSLLLAFSALLGFRRARTTAHPHDPTRTTALVTEGVYRCTRNPMYLAITGLLIGWALWLHDPRAWLAPVLFVPIITRLQIVPEERALRSRFGARYEDWSRRVRRWL